MSDTPASPAPVPAQPPTAFDLDQVQVQIPGEGQPRHKLGWSSRDLAELNAKILERLDRITNKSLDRFEAELDTIPARFLAVPIGIFIDKRQVLTQVPASNTTQNNTVIINGYSRDDAMAFLKGEVVRKGFADAKDSQMKHLIDSGQSFAIDLQARDEAPNLQRAP